MGKVATQDTLLDINDKLKLLLTNNLHTIKNSGQITEALLKKLVQSGQASSVFDIGDQITVKWDSTGDGTTPSYDYDMDVVSFEPVTVTENGKQVSKPAMWLQSHYLLPAFKSSSNAKEGVPYSMPEAAAYTTATIPYDETNPPKIVLYWASGTANHQAGGTYYYFTIPKTIPANSQIVFRVDTSNPNYPMYANCYDQTNTQIFNEDVEVSTSSDQVISQYSIIINEGTSNPVLPTDQNYKGRFSQDKIKSDVTWYTNDTIHSILCGRSIWDTSDLRKWLNSNERDWWEPHNIFARPPANYWKNMPGFLYGLPDTFKNIIKPVDNTTHFNVAAATTSKYYSSKVITKDIFFIPSAYNEYTYSNETQYQDEGPLFEYWKMRLQNTVHKQDKTTDHYYDDNHKRASIADKTTKDKSTTALLRSRMNSSYINASGLITSTVDNVFKNKLALNIQVNSISQCAPVCAIY